MKTRRALQKIVGILSLLVLLCLLAAVVIVGLIQMFPYSMPVGVKNIYNTIRYGVEVVATYLGIGNLWYVPVIVAGILPTQLLLIATILLLSRDNGKQGKYVAGSVLALIGIALLTLFTMVFAADLSTRVETHTWYVAPFSWTSVDTIVRYVAFGLLALFIIFAGSALGVKPKEESVAVSEDAPVETSETEEHASVYETVSPAATQQSSATSRDTEFVPTGSSSVSDVVNGVYGAENKPSANAIDKINKARMLYDMGAITQDEYIKLVNIYTKQ